MKVEISMPSDFLDVWGVEEADFPSRLKLELALHLYASRQVSLGRAAELSGVPRMTFEKAVAERRILRNYSMEDLEQDLAVAEDSTKIIN